MAPCEASRHASIFPSFLVSNRLLGPGTNDPGTGGIKSRRAFGSGSRGRDAGAGGQSLPCRRHCALIITACLAASRWRQICRAGRRPRACAVRQVFSIPVPGPFSDNTVAGCWLNRPMEKDSNLRQSDYESDALPTELSVVQTTGLEPTTCGLYPALSQLSYIRDPNPRSGAVYRAAKPPARAEAKAPTVVLASVFVTGSAPIAPATGCRKRHCRGGFAASFGGGISATVPGWSESDAAEHAQAVALWLDDHRLALARRYAGQRHDIFQMGNHDQIV